MSSGVHEIEGAGPPLVLDVSWVPAVESAHVVVLPLDASGLLIKDYLVLPNRPESPDGALVLRPLQKEEGGAGMRAQLQLDLELVDGEVQSLEIVLAALAENTTLQPIGRVVTQVWDPTSGREHLTMQSPAPGLAKCYILATLDRGATSWQHRTVDRALDNDLWSLANVRLKGITDIS